MPWRFVSFDLESGNDSLRYRLSASTTSICRDFEPALTVYRHDRRLLEPPWQRQVRKRSEDGAIEVSVLRGLEVGQQWSANVVRGDGGAGSLGEEWERGVGIELSDNFHEVGLKRSNILSGIFSLVGGKEIVAEGLVAGEPCRWERRRRGRGRHHLGIVGGFDHLTNYLEGIDRGLQSFSNVDDGIAFEPSEGS